MSEVIVLTEEAVESLKRKHRHLKKFALERGGQEFVVRAPDESEFQRAIDKMAEGGRLKSEAVMEVGEACLVFPDAAAIKQHLAERPGLAFSAGNLALELAGVTDGYGVKKL
jgi:hypothetical protein